MRLNFTDFLARQAPGWQTVLCRLSKNSLTSSLSTVFMSSRSKPRRHHRLRSLPTSQSFHQSPPLPTSSAVSDVSLSFHLLSDADLSRIGARSDWVTNKQKPFSAHLRTLRHNRPRPHLASLSVFVAVSEAALRLQLTLFYRQVSPSPGFIFDPLTIPLPLSR